jgi:hypothetical protein
MDNQIKELLSITNRLLLIIAIILFVMVWVIVANGRANNSRMTSSYTACSAIEWLTFNCR